MANFNRQTDNRDAKRKRRRREVCRKVAKMEADNRTTQTQGGQSQDLTRKIKALRKQMRVNG